MAGRTVGGWVAASIALVMLLGASPAFARSTILKPPPGETPESVLDYWTPQRMSAARPVEIVRDRSTGHVVQRAKPPNVPFTSQQVADPSAPGLRVHGKLFISFGMRNFTCSATSVTSANRSVIFTAAHCLTDKRKVAKKVVFVPAYSEGQQPFGAWTMRKALISPGWFSKGFDGYDYAAVVLRPQTTGLLVNDAVGSIPLFTAAPTVGQPYALFGYPSNFFNTERLWSCGSTFAGYDPVTVGPGKTMAVGCDMRRGESGGAWITNFSLNSVTSYSYDDRPKLLFASLLGDAGDRLLAKAGKVNPSSVGGNPDKNRFRACVAERRGCTHRLVGGDLPQLWFQDRAAAKTEYRVCVKDAVGNHCRSLRTGPKGKKDTPTYRLRAIGRQKATWTVDGRVVRTWSFRVVPESARAE